MLGIVPKVTEYLVELGFESRSVLLRSLSVLPVLGIVPKVAEYLVELGFKSRSLFSLTPVLGSLAAWSTEKRTWEAGEDHLPTYQSDYGDK